ncbi:MAG: HAD family hydrolase [Phycisphaerales bacterium]|nr:MAG: HAD family hydrolase [Phycisphaerales bacterium]
MPVIKAVIFDLDDTLYPERAYAFSGFGAVATAFKDLLGDPAETTKQMERLFDSKHRRRVFNELLDRRGLPGDQQLIDRMIDTYRTHRPTITLHPDADRILTHLQGRYELGLISDGPSISQWAKIDALGLRSRLDEIIITSDLDPDYAKPHPAAFEQMAKRLDVEARQCVYVADNPAKDFIAPNALGWTTIQITRPDGIYTGLCAPDAAQAKRIIDTLDDLSKAL